MYSCEGCYFYSGEDTECNSFFSDCRCSEKNLIWKEMKMNKSNNNNDLSDVQVGDYVWTIQSGWTKVADANSCITHPIACANRYSYDIEGKVCGMDSYPSAFLEPPEFFNAEPKPIEFKKGDRVFVSASLGSAPETWFKAYFSHKSDGYFCAYLDGMTEWSSDGAVENWSFCLKA